MIISSIKERYLTGVSHVNLSVDHTLTIKSKLGKPGSIPLEIPSTLRGGMNQCLLIPIPTLEPINNSSTTPLLFPASVLGKQSQLGRLSTTIKKALHNIQVNITQTPLLTWFDLSLHPQMITLTGWLSLSSSFDYSLH